MPILADQLSLARCPHCSIDRPTLHKITEIQTTDYQNNNSRCWRIYKCSRCGGLVTAAASRWNGPLIESYPEIQDIDESLPPDAREYLNQAKNSLHSPAGSVMLAASAVDAMLKAKQYEEGVLYTRIDQAAEDHVITPDMALWAHQVRLDANDQRHADQNTALPKIEDAKRSLEFVMALGQFMFVLPDRVQRGLAQPTPDAETK